MSDILFMLAMESIRHLSQGNPGALSTLCQLIKIEDGVMAVLCLNEINFFGPKIWLGFNDYCKRDIVDFKNRVIAKDKKMIDWVNDVMNNRYTPPQDFEND